MIDWLQAPIDTITGIDVIQGHLNEPIRRARSPSLPPSFPPSQSLPTNTRIVQYAAGVVCGAVARCSVGGVLSATRYQDLNYYNHPVLIDRAKALCRKRQPPTPPTKRSRSEKMRRIRSACLEYAIERAALISVLQTLLSGLVCPFGFPTDERARSAIRLKYPYRYQVWIHTVVAPRRARCGVCSASFAGAKSKNNMVDFLAGSPRMRESPRMPSLPDVRDPSLKQSSSPRHSKALKTARRMQAPSPEPSIDEEQDCDLEHTIEIVRGMLSRKMCECAAWFEAADLDGNGVIDRDEFRLTVKGLRWGVSNAVCDALFNEMDTDRSGGITHDEYTKYVLRDTLRRQAPTAMQALWLMDEDRSGTIEKWEFRRAVGKMGVIVPNIYLIDELFDEIDTDRSGSLSMDEINFFFRHGRTRKAAMARRCDNVRSKVDRGDSPRRGRSLPMQRPPPMTSLPGLPKLPMPTRRGRTPRGTPRGA